MKYLSFYIEGKRKLGILSDDEKYVNAIRNFSDTESKGETYKINEIIFDVPITPSAIFCTLVNTPAMLGTKDKSEAKSMITSPKFFLKLPTLVVANNQPIITPKDAIRPEVEIAIITGEKKIKNATKKDLDNILGYSVFNDITYPPGLKEDGYYAYRRDPIDGKVKKIFVRGSHFRNKVRDTFAPFGPWIVTPDEINDDINSLTMRSYYNNELIQEGSSEDFIFSIEEIIIELSKIVSIPPYSLISSGSIGYKNAEEVSEYYLKPINNGKIIAEIEKIGKLENFTIIE
ncbi:fumarylacetoacetate hydrolase family protein [Acidianus manzaensis]|uniref:2-hydroxyhepta-2,4-diene-1,7-dioate isomerase n=1 Tax=Acidianus manzaensis TaxID=282676 RepID=A0A1W6JZ75_9CREN|nr:fumarylacetoacetate hydrolase family protein [Acidianus manzaensis]ARM75520.1 2-hydroxyhepta-2,4-diene-1,7-dioate isomerase [Acidianus manzaensis]